MKIFKTVQKKPKTTFLIVITIVTLAWTAITTNADLFGIKSNVIAIGSVILTTANEIYKAIKGKGNETNN